MEGERGRRIEELYQAVRLLYPGQQGDALAEFCHDDTELRREVENLLAHEGAVPTAAPLNAPAWMGNTSASAGPALVRTHKSSIGRYRILRLVAQGGMGAVYEAEQEHPRRIVALKIIKPGLANPETVWRFEQEARALTRLQHPSIAQIYEAGIADTGFGLQHFFAMEFVRGQTLRVYADEQRLTVRQSLGLIIKICDGIRLPRCEASVLGGLHHEYRLVKEAA
jgi:hypothetical protein